MSLIPVAPPSGVILATRAVRSGYALWACPSESESPRKARLFVPLAQLGMGVYGVIIVEQITQNYKKGQFILRVGQALTGVHRRPT